VDFRTAYDKLDGIYYDESSMAGECWALVKAHIASLDARLTAAQERNVVLQSEHLDHVAELHKRIKEPIVCSAC
jgi:hypothetical protein